MATDVYTMQQDYAPYYGCWWVAVVSPRWYRGHGCFQLARGRRALPCNLRNEVLAYTRGALLAKVPIFKGCHPGFREELGRKLKARVYAPGDTVVECGERGDEMFFLNRVR